MYKKIIVSMSGGIDSTIATWLLKKTEYKIEGIFMKNWEEDDNNEYCNSLQDYKDTKKICHIFNIHLHTINFSYEYWKKVFLNFINDYKIGKTPNPDIICNKEIKFKLLLNYVLKILKCDYLATGHYARKILINNNYYLIQSLDKNKDQTYFLYTLSNKELSKIIFPIGYYTKKSIRKMASNLNLFNAKKKSSTGICFIGKRKFNKFISRYLPDKIGDILDINNNFLGKHKGLFYYTIGQRIKINNYYSKSRFYVVFKKKKKNILIVAPGYQNIYLLSKGIIINHLYWNNIFYKQLLIHNILYCYIKIRHTPNLTKCKLFLNKIIKIYFLEKIYSVSIGQSAVLYYNSICLGGGIITKNIPYILLLE